MVNASQKIKKANGAKIDKLEENVAQAIYDLEGTGDFSTELKGLYITKALELDIGNKKAIVICVPCKFLKTFKKIQVRLVRELEKKFSGKHVIIIGDRRILPKPGRTNRSKSQLRARSRSLTAVHEAMLDDIVYPTEIVGKRCRFSLDGGKVLRFTLSSKDKNSYEDRIATFQSVYKKLSNKDAFFEFPIAEEE